jgi:peptidylprolyl isomerase
VAGTKTSRQKAAERRKREEAYVRADITRRAKRRRLYIVLGGLGAIVLILGIVLLVNAGDDDDTVTTASDTTVASTDTTTEVLAASVAGKPCVPRVDPLPEGAPEVAVREGPPPTELIKEDVEQGTGATVEPGSTVKVNYVGVACSTGKIFDSSYGGEPVEFSLNGVIRGWTDGIPGMKVGGKRLLGIPSAQAYGPDGFPPSIAPDEALWFVVEVIETTPAPAGS